MTDNPERLRDGEAEEVWRRAARLQAEAARLADEAGPASPSLPDEEGKDIELVRAAAIEAGIDDRFVQAALDEVRAARVLPPAPADRRAAERFFGGLLDAVTVQRVVAASPTTVVQAAMELFPTEPYRLTLADRIGDPLHAGALVFDIEGLDGARKSWLATEVSSSAVRQIYVSIQPGERAGRCEVSLHGPIAWSHKRGVVLGWVITAVGGGAGGGALGGAVAAALGGALVTPVGWVAAGLATATGLVGGGVLGRQGFRALARSGIERARRALDKVLLALAVRAESSEARQAAAPAPDGQRPR